MKKNKLKKFEELLQSIRVKIVGEVEKSGKGIEVEQMADISDDAARAYDRKLQGDLEEQEWNKLKQVEAALEKITIEEFGICEQCEKEIPEARLEILPYAEFCTQCLSEIEKKSSLDDQEAQSTREP
ncbi:MAG: TraR/DksA family transcriptional regulator [Nitrospina sp.]|jgi:DnaK suppressor protein|nr:TraR/DksA family transcriptional regulator [Nitrospina sp.]MBT6716544.1 TraR/DksA family transcriptional regulator [Nitrospina sp.]